MKFMEIYCEFMNTLPSTSSIHKLYKIIDQLMNAVTIEKVDTAKMIKLYRKLNAMKYETGYAISNEMFQKYIEPYKAQNANMGTVFKGKVTAIYNATEGRKMPIKSADSFCKENELNLKDFFKVYSQKKNYSSETLKAIKNAIIRTFDYAILKGIITENPANIKYHFVDNEKILKHKLSEEEIKSFVKTLINYKDLKSTLIILIYILSDFNSNFVTNIKVKDVNLINSTISDGNKNLSLPIHIKNLLSEYVCIKDPGEYLFGDDKNQLKENSIRTYIYKVRNSINLSKITIECLKIYRFDIKSEIIKQCVETRITKTKALEIGVSEEDYDEFLRFVAFKERS